MRLGAGARPTRCLTTPRGSSWPFHLPPAHLHHGVVAKAPFGATQHRSSIDVDGPPALIGNEEITVVLQLDDTYGNREEQGYDGMGGRPEEGLKPPRTLCFLGPLEGTQDSQVRDLKMRTPQPHPVPEVPMETYPQGWRAARGWEQHPHTASRWYLASGRSSRPDPPETGPRQSGYPWLLCLG